MAATYLVSVYIMSEINILYTFDSKFYKLAAVSMSSVLTHANPDTHCHIYCMVSRGTHGRRFMRKIAKKYGAGFTWQTVSNWRNPYKKFDFSRWSPVIFYRLFAHRAFPKLDKILYLDSDTMVCSDLSEMYNTDISEYTLAAVRDMAPIHNSRGYAPGQYVCSFADKYMNRVPYVNSGVLLLNLKRLSDAQEKLLATDIKLNYPDQDMLNYCLYDKIKLLDLKYNFAPGIPIPRFFPKNQIQAARTSPAIIHFYTVKPYYFNVRARDMYSRFFYAAREIGLHPSDLKKHEEKYNRKRARTKTIFPFVRIKNENVFFLGIKITLSKPRKKPKKIVQ